jgi:hypothetical protein
MYTQKKYPAFLGVYAIPYPILKGCPNLSLFKINKNDLESVINSIFNYFYNTYLKILKPIYLLNIHLQRDNSSIGEIIPAILNIINKLEIIKLTPKLSSSCNSLCELLREEIKTRFNYELNSEIYQVKFLFHFILDLIKYILTGCMHSTCIVFKILGK